jgi:hypothetical protein
VVVMHPILCEAVQSEIIGFKEAGLDIADRVYARPILERCVPETFPDTVRQECDWWIENVGEPAYGCPYSDTMRENFYAVMIEALGKAFCIEGFCE